MTVITQISIGSLDHVKTIIFDCDGVLWLQGQLIEGAVELVNYLTEKEFRVFFVTNNSISSSADYFVKFRKLGFTNVAEDQIIPASRSSAFKMKKMHSVLRGKSVFDLTFPARSPRGPRAVPARSPRGPARCQK